eukprot:2990001-Prymnesium_polylepis.3
MAEEQPRRKEWVRQCALLTGKKDCETTVRNVAAVPFCKQKMAARYLAASGYFWRVSRTTARSSPQLSAHMPLPSSRSRFAG